MSFITIYWEKENKNLSGMNSTEIKTASSLEYEHKYRPPKAGSLYADSTANGSKPSW